jgi:signal transduction histidine kinase
MEGKIQNKNISIDVQIPETVKPVLTDANKLKQILVNLIDNAVKYTHEGSVVVNLGVSPAECQPLRIDITDTGIGIPSERLQDIFEPFFQLRLQNEPHSTGTGLGLSICRSLCDLLGYRLEVASKPGKGSRFSVLFPAEQSLSAGNTQRDLDRVRPEKRVG